LSNNDTIIGGECTDHVDGGLTILWVVRIVECFAIDSNDHPRGLFWKRFFPENEALSKPSCVEQRNEMSNGSVIGYASSKKLFSL
jgi:hypothetical protein